MTNKRIEFGKSTSGFGFRARIVDDPDYPEEWIPRVVAAPDPTPEEVEAETRAVDARNRREELKDKNPPGQARPRLTKAERDQRYCADLKDMRFPPCATCAHLHDNRQKATCDAFLDGIPDAFLKDHAPHNSPYPGDHGIRYKRREGGHAERHRSPDGDAPKGGA